MWRCGAMLSLSLVWYFSSKNMQRDGSASHTVLIVFEDRMLFHHVEWNKGTVPGIRFSDVGACIPNVFLNNEDCILFF